MTRFSRFSTTRKVLLSLSALGAAGTIAGLGTFASFTSSTNAGQQVASGAVTIALGATSAATNRLTVAADNIAPGDTIQRSVDLINQGTIGLSGVTLTTNATTSSIADTDATNGLQMVIDRCSVAWTEAGTNPAFTYTCAGTITSVLATQRVIGANLILNNLLSLTPGLTDFLRVKLTLPVTADNAFQSKTSIVAFSFTATQRTATNQ